MTLIRWRNCPKYNKIVWAFRSSSRRCGAGIKPSQDLKLRHPDCLGDGGRRMVQKWIPTLLLAFAADVLGSWHVWRSAPTDTLRVMYESFWDFESGRVGVWAVCFTLFVGLWLLATRFFKLESSKTLFTVGTWLAVLVFALGIEISTSFAYWNSETSGPVRVLYEGVWYWHRRPTPNDYGWLRMNGYIVDHLFGWFSALLILGIILRLAILGKRKWAEHQ